MTADANKRSSPRVKTLYKGQIVTEGRFAVVDCTVRDLSDGGARIEFGGAYIPPREFELEVPAKQLRFWARMAWSDGTRHGVVFFQPESKGEMRALNEEDASRIQSIIEDARRKIAVTVGVAPDLIKLNLELPRVKGWRPEP